MAASYSWPLALPQKPLADGYSETVPNTLLRSETDTGPAKVRRRGGAKPYTIKANYLLSTEQCEVLDSFLMDTLGGGARCFDWPRPMFHRNADGSFRRVRARIVPSQDGLYTKNFASGLVDRWNVTLTLEIFPDVPTLAGD